jgi:HEPN domain-containing protein
MKNMKEETHKRWIRQAEADYDTAEYNLKGKKYYACANYSQQTAEKSLKALWIFKNKELIKTHSLTNLSKKLNVPEKLILKIASLEPIFKESKYPDVSDKIPAEEYEEQDGIEFLNIAEEVLLWVKNQIK